MFNRKSSKRKYKLISEDGCGITLQLPRYKKTDIKIGTKKEAAKKGLNPRGKNGFYTISDGSVVIDGVLAEVAAENKVEIRVKGNVSISKANWEEIKSEIEYLLNYTEKN